MSAQGGEIREGFLCPMCMKDLGTVSQLQSHFEEAHSTEDKATLNQLRGTVYPCTSFSHFIMLYPWNGSLKKTCKTFKSPG